MAEFTLTEVLQALPQAKVLQKQGDKFDNITTDTRKITQGALFVALKGERFNGEDFAAKAVEAGAAGVLVRLLVIPSWLISSWQASGGRNFRFP